MNVLPLSEIRLGPQSHVSALWWLWLLYRRPHQFRESLETERWPRQLRAGVTLWWHVLPHVFWISFAGRFLALKIGLGSPDELTLGSVAADVAFGIAVGIAFGIAVGIAVGVPRGIASVIAFGGTVGVAVGIVGGFTGISTFGIALGITFGIAFGIGGGIGRGIAVGITDVIAGGFTGAIPFGIGFGIGGGISFGISFGITATRAYYLPVHAIFIWPTVRGRFYPWHPVAWDQVCSTPFPRMDLLLAGFAEFDPEAGEREIERLIADYPSQRDSALRARSRLIARKAGRCENLREIGLVVGRLPEGERGFLRQTAELKTEAASISRQYQAVVQERLPAFRLAQSQRLCDQVTTFRDRIAGFAEPLASEFRQAAEKWLVVAQRFVDEAQQQSARERIAQVFRAGDPVNPSEDEAFVPRRSVIDELAGQVLASTGCPGLLLYARRRMGKSTCVKNLMGFLPADIEVANINLQAPAAHASQAHFCRHVADQIRLVTGVPGNDVVADVLGLERFLSSTQEHLGGRKRTLLVALDEYEYVDKKLGERVFSEDLLALLRTSIQTHRRIIWLLTGSHRITELKAAEWPSYLISMQTVELDRFTSEETHKLLTDPLAHSRLWRSDDPHRPRFEPMFWGDEGPARIQREADGWPHLVQLLAATAIELVNRKEVPRVTDELWPQVLAAAVLKGENVMIQLLKGESELPGEWDYLRRLGGEDSLPPPLDRAILDSLRRRSLVQVDGGQVRLRVPLMRRWIHERADIHAGQTSD